MSAPCRDLLARLLVADPGERMTMAEIKVHSWFLEDLPDGALAMNDWYLQSRPVHDQARRPRPAPAPAGPASRPVTSALIQAWQLRRSRGHRLSVSARAPTLAGG